MKPIGDFAELLGKASLEQYLALYPPPVLLQHAATGAFQRLSGEPGETLFRFDDDAKPQPSQFSLPKEVAYMVLGLHSSSQPDQARLLVGCDEICDVRVRDASVSREHAWVERRKDGVYIRDAESTLGTKINGQRLLKGQERKLVNSDQVMLGMVNCTYLDPQGFYLFAREFLGL